MESLSAGTFVGSGSFRCQRCGYALTLEGSDVLAGLSRAVAGRAFLRASLFSTERISNADRPADRGDARPGGRRRTSASDWTRRVRRSTSRASTSSTRKATSCSTVAALARVDADRAQPRGRPALRRPDGLAASRADRAPPRRRPAARRPQPQRRVRQRRADRRPPAPGRRRDHRRALPAELPARRLGGAGRPAGGLRRASPRPAERSRAAEDSRQRSIAPMAKTIAVLSQKGGTGKTTAVRTLTDVLRRAGAAHARGRPRSAGQPLGLLRPAPRRRADDRATCSPGARRSTRRSSRTSSPPTCPSPRRS